LGATAAAAQSCCSTMFAILRLFWLCQHALLPFLVLLRTETRDGKRTWVAPYKGEIS
jgi:hypothetical protein